MTTTPGGSPPHRTIDQTKGAPPGDPSGGAGAPAWWERCARLFGRGAPLRRQVLILLALALLPGAVYAVLVAQGAYRADQDRVRETLRQRAVAAANGEREVITGAERVAKALALVPGLLDDPAACATLLARVRDNYSEYHAAVVSDAEGNVICAAPTPGRPPPPSVVGQGWFQVLMSKGRPTRAAEPTPLIEGETAMVIAVPIPGKDGGPAGAVALVPELRNGLLVEGGGGKGQAEQETDPTEDGAYLLLDAEGTALPGSDIPHILPRGGLPGGVVVGGDDADGAQVFTGTGMDGMERIYALTTLPRGSVGVLFSQPEDSALDWVRRDLANRLIGPFAMLLFTLAVTWVAMDRLVLHWLGRLRRTARVFARGDLAHRPDLGEAPLEVRELGQTLSRMAETIQHREEELEENLRHRDVLLKEIHHRVKNNLQVVSSLLSLQHRGLPEGAARVALMQAQTRINALATVHRNLYETKDPTLVNLGTFGAELAQLTHDGLGAASRRIRLETHMDKSVMVDGDRAVPMALILTEALTNAIKHAYPKGGPGCIAVTLAPRAPEPEDGAFAHSHVLTIDDDGVGPSEEGAAGKGLGATLMPSLARQAGGRMEVSRRPGGGTRVRMWFTEATSSMPPFRAVTDP